MTEEAYYRMVGDKYLQVDNRQFSHPVFNAPADGVPLRLGIGASGQKTRMMELSHAQKSFKIGLAVSTQ